MTLLCMALLICGAILFPQYEDLFFPHGTCGFDVRFRSMLLLTLVFQNRMFLPTLFRGEKQRVC